MMVRKSYTVMKIKSYLSHLCRGAITHFERIHSTNDYLSPVDYEIKQKAV